MPIARHVLRLAAVAVLTCGLGGARLSTCRAIGMSPDPQDWWCQKEGAPSQISDYSQNSSILRLRYPVLIALTAGNEARISRRISRERLTSWLAVPHHQAS